jgi:hypothetical protein
MKIYLAIIFIAIGIMCQKLSAQEKPETLIDFSCGIFYECTVKRNTGCYGSW